MNIRKERSHHHGAANIDYRTKAAVEGRTISAMRGTGTGNKLMDSGKIIDRQTFA
jgi:hypothetical protein